MSHLLSDVCNSCSLRNNSILRVSLSNTDCSTSVSSPITSCSTLSMLTLEGIHSCFLNQCIQAILETNKTKIKNDATESKWTLYEVNSCFWEHYLLSKKELSLDHDLLLALSDMRKLNILIVQLSVSLQKQITHEETIFKKVDFPAPFRPTKP